MIVLVTLTIGLVVWIVAWALRHQGVRRLPLHRDPHGHGGRRPDRAAVREQDPEGSSGHPGRALRPLRSPGRPAASRRLPAWRAAAAGRATTHRVHGDTLTVYAGAPAHGTWAASGEAALAGARRALSDAGGRAGAGACAWWRSRRPGRRTTHGIRAPWRPAPSVRSTTPPRSPTSGRWTGARRRSRSRSPTVRGLLQVSPTDGLTSLTVSPPGRPRAGPERYYPDEKRTFERVVPPDLQVARAMLGRVPPPRRAGSPWSTRRGSPSGSWRGRWRSAFAAPGTRRVLVEPLRDPSPRVARGRAGGRAPRRDPPLRAEGCFHATPCCVSWPPGSRRCPVIAGPELARPARAPGDAEAVTAAAPRPSAASGWQEAAALAGHARPEALYGYEAMSLVLDAIAAAGPDRAAVIAAAVRAPHRPEVGAEVRRSAWWNLGPGARPAAACLLRGAALSN